MLDWPFLFFHGRPLFPYIYSEGFATRVAFGISSVVADGVPEPKPDWCCDDYRKCDCLFGGHALWFPKAVPLSKPGFQPLVPLNRVGPASTFHLLSVS